jgi:hypothetical protein
MAGNRSGGGDRTSGRMRHAAGSAGDWLVRWSREGPEPRAARKAAQKTRGTDRRPGWAATVIDDNCRWLRWPLAAAVILGALIIDVVSLTGNTHLACQVTITRAGTTRVCGALSVADYAPALAVALLLLVPWWRVKYFRALGSRSGCGELRKCGMRQSSVTRPKVPWYRHRMSCLAPGVRIEPWSAGPSLRSP